MTNSVAIYVIRNVSVKAAFKHRSKFKCIICLLMVVFKLK